MTADELTAAQVLAECQKDDVRRRLNEGMRLISIDIDQTYDSTVGFSRYPANHGRVSVAEVLRRSGGVDKNTLKQPYHAGIRKAVDDFVREVQTRCVAHSEADARVRAAESAGKRDTVERFAQLLRAAEFNLDVARTESERLRADLASKIAHIDHLELEVRRLYVDLSAGKVVRLRDPS